MKDTTIGIDVDGCLANFIQHVIETAEKMEVSGMPSHWTEWRAWQGPSQEKALESVKKEVWDDPEWWMNISPIDDVHFTFKPDYYITARDISSEVTRKWINRHGFPDAEVCTVGVEKSKVPAMKKYGVDLLVDDKPETFDEVNEVDEKTCLLLNRPVNQNVPTESGFYLKEDDRVINTDLRLMYLADVPIWVSEYGEFIQF